MTDLQIFLVFIDCDGFEKCWSGISKTVSQCWLDCSCLFLATQRWNVILVTSEQGYMPTTWSIPDIINLDILAEGEFATFSYFPFPYSLWKLVTKHSPHSRNGELSSTFLRGEISIKYLEFFCAVYLSLLPIYLFIQSFVYITVDLWIFILYFRL